LANERSLEIQNELKRLAKQENHGKKIEA